MKLARAWLLLGYFLVTTAALANPNGATVVNGTASFTRPNANTLNIHNSRNAIINWQRFNIGAGQTTNFIQPGSNSAVLNRVLGNNPSQIYGNLNSNGKVFLVNQHGLMIGAGARINTAGFYGSTLNITNQDFLQGKLNFEGGGYGGIVNRGYIHAGPGGDVVLIAPDVENGGVIEVENGNVVLAAGESIRITSLNDSSIEFDVQSNDDNSLINLGSIIAKQGAAHLFAGNLKHSGSINATGLVRNADGTISLVANQNIEVTDGATLNADGGSGGNVLVQSHHGDVYFSGTATARGETHHGGDIQILGERVGLFGSAMVDASGQNGGGEVLIGGDFQGNGDVQTASQTQVSIGSSIHADALESGDGGKVIVWADDFTLFNGEISVKGGSAGGDGGFVEVSGKENLGFDGQIDVGANHGQAGSVLLDPNNITIQTTGSDDPEVADGLVDFGDGFGFPPPDFTISASALEALFGDITLRAEVDITLLGSVSLNLIEQTGGEIFALHAGGNITIAGDITTQGASVLLSAGDPGAAVPAGTAAISVTGDINTNGGTITLNNNAGSGGISTSGNLLTGTGVVVDFVSTTASTISGGTFNGILRASGAGDPVITGNVTFDGVTLDTDLTIANNADLFVLNDLVLGEVDTPTPTITMASTGANTYLYFQTANATLGGTGTVLLGGTSNNNNVYNNATGTLTIGSNITVRGGGDIGTNSANNLTFNQGAILADTPGRIILTNYLTNDSNMSATNGGTLQMNGDWVNNPLATISADNSTLSLGSSGRSWTNFGSIAVNNGATLSTAGIWSNSGVLSVISGSSLNLGGSFTLGDFNSLTRDASISSNLTGTLDIGGGILELSNSSGDLYFSGGTLSNGTITAIDGRQYLFAGIGGLSGITLDTDLTLPNARDLYITGDLTLGGANNPTPTLTMESTGSNTYLYFQTANATLGGTGTILLGGTSNNNNVYNNGVGTLTIGPDITIRGGGDIGTNSVSYPTDNQGTILADTPGRIILTNYLSNSGTMSATNGGTLQVYRAWTNSGSITVDASTLALGSSTQVWTNNGTITAINNSNVTTAGTWTNNVTLSVTTGSSLNLGGSFTLGDFNSLTRDASITSNLTGTLDIGGGILELSNSSGDLYFSGGTLSNGTITAIDGRQYLFAGIGGLSGITLDTDLIQPNARDLHITGDFTLGGANNPTPTLTMESTGSNTYLYFQTANATLGGTGTILLGGTSNNNNVYNNGVGTLTIGPDITIRGGGDIGTNSVSYPTDNQGTILADTPGRIILTNYLSNSGTMSATNGGTLQVYRAWTNSGSITVDASTLALGSSTQVWTNNGTITAINNSNVTTAGTWTNNVTLSVTTGSTLNLGGSFTLGDFNSLTRDASITSNLTGTLDIGGGILELSNSSGDLYFSGGTLSNGTITAIDGRQYLFAGIGGLSGITLDTDLIQPNARDLHITGDFTLGGANNPTPTLTMESTGSNTYLYFQTANATLGGTGTILLGGTSNNNNVYNNGVGTLTIGPDITIRGGGDIGTNSASYPTDNQGTILADTPGRIILTNYLSNSGTMSATNGGTLQVYRVWTNSGSITADASTLTFGSGTQLWTSTGPITTINNSVVNLDGSFTLASYGSLVPDATTTTNLVGTMDLGGGILSLDNSTGDLYFAGGTLLNGTITADLLDGRQYLFSGLGRLDNITLDTDLIQPNARDLYIYSGLTLGGANNPTPTLTMESTGSNTYLYFMTANDTLGGTGTILLGGTSNNNNVYNNAIGTLTIGPNITISGGGDIGTNSASYPTDNQGTILADTPGRIILTNYLSNSGTMSATNGGTLQVYRAWTNSGSITADASTLTFGSGTQLWTSTGPITTINNSVVNLDGSFTLASYGSLVPDATTTTNLVGTLDLGGGILSLDNSTGNLYFAGGTLLNGTITADLLDGRQYLFSGLGRLDNITLDTDLIQPNARDLYIYNGLTLGGANNPTPTLTMESTGSNTYLYFMTANDTLGGTGTILFGGTSNNNNIYNNAPGTLTIGAGITIRGGGDIGTNSSSYLLDNQGAILADTSGRTILAYYLTNSGVVTVSNGAVFSHGNGTLTNNSTLTVESGGTLSNANRSLNNTGLLQGGGTINLGTGTLTNTGFVAPGIGVDSTDILTLNGAFTQTTGELQIELNGTTPGSGFDQLSVNGNVTLAGDLTVTLVGAYSPTVLDTYRIIDATGFTLSGSFSGVVTVPSQYQLTPGADYFDLLRTYSIVWSTGATDSDWFNLGNWEDNQGQPALALPGAGDEVGITAAGPVNFGTGASATVLSLFSNQDFNMQAGTLTITGSAEFENLAVSGGTLGGAGDITVNGLLTWSAGTFSGAGTLFTSGPTNITAAAVPTLGRDWTNNPGGVIDWQSASLVLNGILTNLGSFTSSASSSLTINSGFVFDNQGLFSNDANTDLAGLGGFTQTAGTLRLNGGDLNITGLIPTLSVDGGVLEGNGTLTGSVTNNGGVIRPGLTGLPGTLTISTNFTQVTGSVEIDIASTGVAGTAYDLLAIGGSATFADTVELIALAGYSPVNGHSFDPITYSSTGGSFSNVILPAGAAATPVYGGASVSFLFSLNGLIWIGGGADDNWTTLGNWNTGVLPTTSDDVFIDTGFSVIIDSVANAQNLTLLSDLSLGSGTTLTLDPVGILSIEGANFTLAGGTLVNATVTTVNGGSLTMTANSFFNGVTLDTDLTVPNGRQLRITGNGLVINAPYELELASTGSFTYLIFDTTAQTLGGDGSVLLGGTSDANYLYGNTAGPLTIGSSLSIHGGGQVGTNSASYLVTNDGAITADAGRVIRTWYVTNSATGMLVADAGTLTVDGTWVNNNATNGSLQVGNGGTLNLDGSFNTSSLTGLDGTSVGGGGTINMTGLADLGASSYSPTALSGPINIAGGTILNGTLQDIPGTGSGSSWNLTANSFFNGITLDTDFTIPNGRQLHITGNGLVINAPYELELASTGSITYLIFDTTAQTLGGDGSVLLGGTSNANYLYGNTAGPLTIGSNLSIHGGGQVGTNSPSYLVTNDGAITADAGRVITTWYVTNSATGTLVSDAGTLTVDGTWANNNATNGSLQAANGGTLNLDGSFNTSSLTGLDGTSVGGGGTINLTGLADLGASSYSPTALSGPINIAGGTILNGTLQDIPGTGSGSSWNLTANSFFNGITLDTDFTIPNGRQLRITGNGLVINAPYELELASTGSITYLIFDTTAQTLGGDGSVLLGGTSNANYLYGNTAGPLTIGSNLSIHGGGQVGTNSPSYLVTNDGAITADAGRVITTWYVTNSATGTLVADAGTLTVDGTWANNNATNGSLQAANGGTLNLDGSFNTSSLTGLDGTSVGGGGTINLTGLADLGASSYSPTALSGPVNIAGATIQNGILQDIPGGHTGSSWNLTANSFFNGITLDTDFTIPNSRIFYVDAGDLTLGGANNPNPTLTLASTGSFTYLYFRNTSQSLLGTGTILFGGSSINNQLYVGSSGTSVTISPNITVRGGGYVGTNGANYQVDNQGTIVTDPGRNITTYYLTNNGAGTITADQATLTMLGAWTNNNVANGSLMVSNGGTLNLDGVFDDNDLVGLDGTTIGGGGSINLTGTLNLDIGSGGSGSYSPTALSGPVNIAGATIQNGILQDIPGGHTGSSWNLTVNSFFNGITMDTDFTIPNSRIFFVDAGDLALGGANNPNPTLTLASSGGATYLYFRNTSQSLLGTGTILFGGSSNNNNLYIGTSFTSLTIGSNITVRGGGIVGTNGANYQVDNQGTIIGDTPGRTITTYYLTNNGAITADSGMVSMQGTWSNPVGSLAAINGGLLSLTGSWTNNTAINIDGSTLSTSGNWTNTAALTGTSGSTFNLGGSFATSSIDLLANASGSNRLSGTVDNSADILALDAVSGDLHFVGGTITNGTITATGGARYLLDTGNGTLDGVILDADLDIVNGRTLTVSNGITLGGANNPSPTITLSSIGTATYLGFNTVNQTIGGTGTIDLTTLTTQNRITQTLTNSTLTIGAGIMVQGPGIVGDNDATRVINNLGTISANGGLPLTLYGLDNNGAVIAENSSLLSLQIFNTNNGSMTVDSGSTISTNNQSVLNNDSIEGGGLFTLGSGTLTNAGIVAPGIGPDDTAILTVTGTYVQTTGLLQIELGGTSPGTQYDQLLVNGNVTVAGDLTVTLTGGYLPALDDRYRVISTTGGALGGSFDGALTLPPAISVEPSQPTYIELVRNFLATITWTGATDTDWFNPANWDALTRTPDFTDDVLIDVNGPVVFNGTETVNSLSAIQPLTITNGSSLTLSAGTSSVLDLTLDGGSVVSNGDLVITASFNWTGGNVSGTGTLTTDTGSVTTLAQNVVILDADWDNRGTINWTGANSLSDIVVENGAVLTNYGSFNLQTINNLQDIRTTTSGSFINLGVLDKQTGVDLFIRTLFNNGNTVNVNAGLLSIAGNGNDIASSYNVAPGATLRLTPPGTRVVSSNISGAGDLELIPGQNAVINFTGGDINITGSTLISGTNTLGIPLVDLSGASVSSFGGSLTLDGNNSLLVTLPAATDLSSIVSLDINRGSVTLPDAMNLAALDSITRDASGTLVMGNNSVTVTTLVVNGGILTGSGNITVTGSLLFNNGTIDGAGLLTTNGGVTTTLASTNAAVLSRDWINLGIVNWTGLDGLDDFIINSGATFTNQNIFNVQTVVNAQEISTVDTGIFVNQGTFDKQSAVDTNVRTDFNNSGLVDINDGNLLIAGNGTDTGGSYQINNVASTLEFQPPTSGLRTSASDIAGIGDLILRPGQDASIVFTGDINLGGTTLIAGTNSLGTPTADLSAGTITSFGASLTLDGNNNMTVLLPAAPDLSSLNSLIANAGSMAIPDSINLAALAVLTRAGSGTLDLGNNALTLTTLTVSGGTLTGSGNYTVSGSFDFSGGTVAGAGLLTTTNTAVSALNGGTVMTMARDWINDGAVNWTGVNSLNDFIIDAAATVTNSSSGIFNVQTISSNQDIRTTTTGFFVNDGTFDKQSSFDLNILADFVNNNDVTVRGLLSIGGGSDTLSGSYTLIAGSTLEFTPPASTTRNIASDISGNGIVIFRPGQNGGVVFTGTLNTTGSTLLGGVNSLGTPTLDLTGATITSFGSSLTLDGNNNMTVLLPAAPDLSSLNSLIANTGSMTIPDSMNLAALAVLSRAGSGTLDLGNNALTLTTLTVLGGTLLTDASITVGSLATWNGISTIDGNTTGSLTINPGAIFNISGTLGRTLDGIAVDNQGTTNFSAATLLLENGTTFDNNSLFEFQADNIINTATSGSFNSNSGAEIRKTTTVGLSDILVPLSISASSHVTDIQSGTFGSAGLTLTLDSGGILRGSGSFGGDVTLSGGTIQPGSSSFVGTLTLGGNLTITSGTIEIEVDNVGTPGLDYDLLDIAGNLTFISGPVGSLDMIVISGYIPSDADNFTPLNYASVTGAFASINPISPATIDIEDYTANSGTSLFLQYSVIGGGNPFEWTGGGDGSSWLDDANWFGGTAPTIFDDADIPSGSLFSVTIAGVADANTLTLGADATLTLGSGSLTISGASSLDGQLIMSGGGLDLTGTVLTVNGDMNWNATSTISGGGSGSLLIAPGATLDLSNNVNHTLNNVTLDNQGTTRYTNGNLYLNNGAVIDNNGVFDFQQGTVTTTFGSGTFNNNATGQVIKSVNNASAFESSIAFTNTNGSFNASQGSIIVRSSSTFNGTVTSANSSSLVLNGTAVFNDGSIVDGDFTLSGGTMTVNGNLLVNDTLSWDATSTITGPGTLTIASGATLDLSNNVNHTMSGATLDNQGTTRYTNGNLYLNNGAVIDNNGVFDFQQGTVTTTFGSGTFNNNATGQVIKSVNNASAFESSIAFTNTNGSFNASQGSIIVRSSSTFNGTVTSANSSSLVLNGTAVFNDGSIVDGDFTLSGGTMTVNGNLLVNDTLSWDATSTITGPGTLTIASGATLDIVNNVNHTLNNVTLDNQGTTRYTNGNLYLNNGAVIDNNGVFDFQQGTVTTTFGSGTFNNNATGQVIKSVNNASAFESSIAFTNTNGIFNASQGSIIVRSSSTFNGTVTSANSSSLVLNGTAVFNDGSIVDGDFTLSGGTMTVNGNLLVNDTLSWDATSTITGPGTLTIASGATLDIVNNVNHTLNNVTLDNQGTTRYTNGNLYLNNGAVIDNNGVFDFQQGTVTTTFGSGTFNNNPGASMVKTTATVSSISTAGVAFINDAATIDIQAGTFGLGGDVLDLNSGSQLSGAGTFNGDVVNNGGVIRPGGAGTVGTLTIFGDFTNTAGVLEVDIDSALSFDVLAVSGTANLNGAINVSLSYVPLVGTQQPVVTCGAACNGTFASLGAPTGITYGQVNQGASLDLDVLAVSFTWIGSDGNWNNASNWSLGFVPNETVDVVLPSVNLVVTDFREVNSLVMNPGAQLTLNGPAASLEIGRVSSGGLTVNPGAILTNSGGILTNSNNADINGTFTNNAGVSTFSGNTTVGGAFGVGGGAVNLNGVSTFNGSLGVAGGTLILDGVSADLNGPLNMTGGVIAFNAGQNRLGGSNNTWSGGTWLTNSGGTLFMQPDSTLDVGGSGPKLLQGVDSTFTLDMTEGDINMSGSGSLNLVSAVIDNTGGTSFFHQGNGALIGDTSSQFINNGGLFENVSGTATILVDFVNDGGSRVNVLAGTLLMQDTDSADLGAYRVDSGASLVFAANRVLLGSLENNGSLGVSNAVLVMQGSLTNNGRIQLANGTLNLAGQTLQLNNSASLGGSGVVQGNVINNGLLLVGGAAAIDDLEIQGNYQQDPNGVLVVEIFNNGVATQSDQLTVTGATRLNGGALVIGFTTNSLGVVTADIRPLVLEGGVTGNFSQVIDAGGNILFINFAGGVFTIFGASPKIPDAVIDDLIAFINGSEELTELISSNRSVADTVIAKLLERNEEDEENLLVCK